MSQGGGEMTMTRSSPPLEIIKNGETSKGKIEVFKDQLSRLSWFECFLRGAGLGFLILFAKEAHGTDWRMKSSGSEYPMLLCRGVRYQNNHISTHFRACNEIMKVQYQNYDDFSFISYIPKCICHSFLSKNHRLLRIIYTVQSCMENVNLNPGKKNI